MDFIPLNPTPDEIRKGMNRIIAALNKEEAGCTDAQQAAVTTCLCTTKQTDIAGMYLIFPKINCPFHKHLWNK